MLRALLLASASALALCGMDANATTFDYTGAIQTFDVTSSGLYRVTATGGQGGANFYGRSPIGQGGLGALVGGDVTLRAGTVLDIVVAGAGAGGAPGEIGSFWYGGGGGGGSFVFTPSAALPLFVAGGGGGASTQFFNSGPGGSGQAGSAGEKGLGGVYNPVQGPGSVSGYGGVDGGGGKAGHSGNYQQPGGGGAGWSGKGGGYAEPVHSRYTSFVGYTYSGGAGGSTRSSFAGGQSGFSHTHAYIAYGYAGGFGGGGGGGYIGGGGGGGGFSGGGGGGESFGNRSRFYGGGGGGSYVGIGATDITDIGGVNSGNGLVTITELAPLPEPKAWSLMFTGLGFVGYVLRRRLTSRLRRA